MEQKPPTWFWFSLVPVIGGLSIVYAGNKVNRSSWANTGIFLTVLGLILNSSHLLGFVWLAQIGIAYCFKDEYLERINNSSQKFANNKPLGILPTTTTKIDINNCSKDELVRGLGLPIVYANEIESARHEGHIFTHIEELMDIAGIPDSYLSQLEATIIFSYDIKKEADFSWRRCNTLSQSELIACNLDPQVATKIIQERDKNGTYKSFPDLRKRTRLPLHKLTNLL